MDFFALFLGKRLVIQKKAVPLHSQNGNKPIAPWNTEQQIKKFAEFSCKWGQNRNHLIMPSEAENAENFEEDAEIAQLVEHNLAKVRVASSSLVFRSQKFEFVSTTDESV